eukprot:gene4706-4957_t
MAWRSFIRRAGGYRRPAAMIPAAGSHGAQQQQQGRQLAVGLRAPMIAVDGQQQALEALEALPAALDLTPHLADQEVQPAAEQQQQKIDQQCAAGSEAEEPAREPVEVDFAALCTAVDLDGLEEQPDVHQELLNEQQQPNALQALLTEQQQPDGSSRSHSYPCAYAVEAASLRQMNEALMDKVTGMELAAMSAKQQFQVEVIFHVDHQTCCREHQAAMRQLQVENAGCCSGLEPGMKEQLLAAAREREAALAQEIEANELQFRTLDDAAQAAWFQEHACPSADDLPDSDAARQEEWRQADNLDWLQPDIKAMVLAKARHDKGEVDALFTTDPETRHKEHQAAMRQLHEENTGCCSGLEPGMKEQLLAAAREREAAHAEAVEAHQAAFKAMDAVDRAAFLEKTVADNEVVQQKKYEKEHEDIKHIKEFIASCGMQYAIDYARRYWLCGTHENY